MHSKEFHYHRGLELKTRQIPDLPFIHLVDLVHPSSAARTKDGSIPPLSSDPHPQMLVLFIDLTLVHPISGESQYLCPVVLHHQPSLAETSSPGRFRTGPAAHQ